MAYDSSTSFNSSNNRSPFFVWIAILLTAIIGTTFSSIAVASCYFLSVPFVIPSLPSQPINLGYFRADNGVVGCAAYGFIDEWDTDSRPALLRAARAFGIIAPAISGMALLALLSMPCRKTMQIGTRRALHCLTSRVYIFAFVSQLLAILLFVRSVEVSCGGGPDCAIKFGYGAALAIIAGILFLFLGVFMCTCDPLSDKNVILGPAKSQGQHAVGPDKNKAEVSRPEESVPADESNDGFVECNL